MVWHSELVEQSPNLRGELLRAPEMEGVERFTPEDMHLKPVQVAALGPLIFANLDLKAPPLAEFLSDEIQAEDIEIRETVQKNLRSRVYDRAATP